MIIFLVLLLLLVAAFIISQNLKITALVDFSENGVSADAYCLYPMLRMHFELENNTLCLSIYVFKIKVYKNPLRRNEDSQHKAVFLRSVSISDLVVNTYYGFNDPFSTGFFSGLLGITKVLPFPVQINQYPDFFPTSNYLRIEASGYLNLGNTIKNMLKNKRRLRYGEPYTTS
jgi:hypothetical protein